MINCLPAMRLVSVQEDGQVDQQSLDSVTASHHKTSCSSVLSKNMTGIGIKFSGHEPKYQTSEIMEYSLSPNSVLCFQRI